MKKCRKNKTGSWTLSKDYLDYRKQGGNLNPEAWNGIVKTIQRQVVM